MLPFTGAFARLMTRLLPDRGPDLTGRLETILLSDARAATLALLGSVHDTAGELFEGLARALTLEHAPRVEAVRLSRVRTAVDEARRYAGRIVLPSDLADRGNVHRPLLSAMHVIDHLDRLEERARKEERIETLRGDARLHELAALVREALSKPLPSLYGGSAAEGTAGERSVGTTDSLKRARDAVREDRRSYRTDVMAMVPDEKLPLEEALRRLDAVRWLHRTAYHAWRISLHLERAHGAGRDASEVELGPSESEDDEVDLGNA